MREPVLTRRALLRRLGGLSALAAVSRFGIARAHRGVLPGYDDGSEAIPGGVAGEPERVVVVGAGFAGLAVANALGSAGVEAIVVEGRDRIGGRAWTRDVGGHPIDLGCSWIHEPVGNPMTRFALEAGVLHTPADIELDLATFRFVDGDEGVVPLPDALDTYGHFVRFLDEAASISDELGPEASARDGVLAYLDRHGLDGAAHRRVQFLLRLITEQPDATDWDRLSFAYWASYEPAYVGVGQGNFPVGGYRGLVEALRADSDVRLGHRVTTIAWDDTGVRVTAETADGPVELDGSHVVVTVPLGILQAGTIGFDPGLPAAKTTAIRRMQFGQFEKVVLAFDLPWWEREGQTHVLHRSRTGAMEFPLFADHHRLTGAPALVGFNSAAFARGLADQSPDAVRDLALDVLGRVYGSAVPAPTDVAVTNWYRDPFSMGSYSSVVVGGTFDDFDTLAEPVAGRVLFAGEATNRDRFGYADGALSTGIREAKRLLGTSTVRLRPSIASLRLS